MRVALTMGDVAGIGPEIIARAVTDPCVSDWCRPVVVGNAAVLRRAIQHAGLSLDIVEIDSIDREVSETSVACYDPGDSAADDVPPGEIHPDAGNAAYRYLIAATDGALSGRVDAITTAPLNKASLHSAGHDYPGHTEILADRCGVSDFAMMLYLPVSESVAAQHGLGVVHVTLHTSIRSVPDLLSVNAVFQKIGLIHRFMQDVGCASPRIGVCAVNPHGGESGIFGDEEARFIEPAVFDARDDGIDAAGPFPADTLLRRAVAGEFDAVVAMFHDQGHIALKLIAFDRAVNVTLGLPIVRTSPSHGTAFDIAWKEDARADGMIEAIRVATLLARERGLCRG